LHCGAGLTQAFAHRPHEFLDGFPDVQSGSERRQAVGVDESQVWVTIAAHPESIARTAGAQMPSSLGALEAPDCALTTTSLSPRPSADSRSPGCQDEADVAPRLIYVCVPAWQLS
jgi:hypothetical protein